MVLNDAGKMVETWYDELENKYPNQVGPGSKANCGNAIITNISSAMNHPINALRNIINNPAKWEADKFYKS